MNSKEIEFDDPERLPLGHKFVNPTGREYSPETGCAFIIKGIIEPILCGKTEAEHLPVKMGILESIISWIKGSLSCI